MLSDGRVPIDFVVEESDVELPYSEDELYVDKILISILIYNYNL